MPTKVVHYTRYVTMAWCVFFAGQLFVSIALLLFASEATWSAFIHWLNVPLIAGMMLAEFSVRLILFRHEPRTGLMDTLAALRCARATPVNRP
jgi:uncharacterized membrane protein